MTVKQFGVRLKAEGGPETVTAVKSVETAVVHGADAADAANTRAAASAERLAAKYTQMAQAAQANQKAAAAQGQFNALLGVDRPVQSARISAEVFGSADDDARKAAALREIIDPLAAAQGRYNDELAEYTRLQRAGILTTNERIVLEGKAKDRLDETTAALSRQERGMSRLALASRLNLARQGADVFVTGAMGMNPGMIAIQQGPQIIDALATSGIKATGSLLLLGGALTAVAAGAVAVGVGWSVGEKSALGYDRAVMGAGRTAGLTAEQLRTLTIEAAEQGDVSIKSAQAQATAYLATGRIGGEVISGLIAVHKDYAVMVGQEAEAATQSLAKAMLEPDKAARQLTREMGLLDQKTLEYIDSLVEAGKREEAQKVLLDSIAGAASGHAAKVGEITNAWQAAGRAISDATTKFGEWLYVNEAEKLQNNIDFRGAMERRGGPRTASEQAAYDAAGARALGIQAARQAREGQVAGSAENQAAQEAKDRRDAASAGNRRGQRDAERQAREQLQRERREEDRAAMIALEVARGRGDIDSQRLLEDASAVRTRERQLIDDGTEAEEARTKALREQGQLLTARAAATEREVEGLFRANAVEVDRLLGNNRLVQQSERHADLVERIDGYVKAGEGYYGAWLKAQNDLLLVEEARAEVAQRTADARDRDWRLTLAQASGDRRTARALDRDQWIDRRAREIEGDADKPLNLGDGVQQATQEYGQLMRAETTGAMRAGLTSLVSDIRRSGIRAAMSDQLSRAGDRMIENIIDGLSKVKWGESGVGGWISKGIDFLFGKNAEGTNDWRGGLTWVGERGKELVNLPGGSQVFSHGQSMSMAQRALGGGGPRVTNNYFSGNLMTPDFWAEIRRGDVEAAQQGMYGGADLAVGAVRASAESEQRQRRMLKA